MIRINFLFPSEKRQIKKIISKEIKKRYQKNITAFTFTHVGDEKIYLYAILEDDTVLYITAEIGRIVNTMTICDDMSL